MVTVESSANADELDVEHAVTAAGFGKYSVKIAILGGLIYMNTALSIGSVGFILPSAACDLELSTLDKGRISATPILGMAAGSFFWGCLADLKGRRMALLYALFAYGIVEIISSLVTTYWLFLVLKFISGWLVNGQSAISFTYSGEFQSSVYREKILSWMEMAWTLGLIVLPLIGWVVLPLEFSYVTEKFVFRSWNLFIIVCAIPSILIGFWVSSFPDTPKYLIESKQDGKLARTLEEIHAQNTGGNFDEYLNKLSENGHDNLRTRLALARQETEGKISGPNPKNHEFSISPSKTKSELFLSMLRTIFRQSIELWQPPYLRNTSIVCGIMFCIGSSYYALMLWFPEVFQRFAAFEELQPEKSASVCTISSRNWTMNNDPNESMEECPSTVHNYVYVQTLILGLSCLPVSILLPLCVARLGYKFYLVTSATIAAGVTLGFFYVRSSTENLVLSCIFEAFSSVCLSTMMCITVDLFPTNLRAMAAALAVFFARIGALFGNTIFGYLIDEYCIPLIAIIAGQLILSAVLSLLLPGKSKTCSS